MANAGVAGGKPDDAGADAGQDIAADGGSAGAVPEGAGESRDGTSVPAWVQHGGMRKRYLAGGGELAGDGERVWPELRRGGSGGKVA